MSAPPVSLSQVPGSPTFRSSAVNAIAVIPLLSSDRTGHDNLNTHSSQSFHYLLTALSRYHSSQNASSSGQRSTSGGVGGVAEDLLLVIPNANLTRPGDWKYEETPLKNFHWGHGCQRMTFFDGRPYNSRMAHDRLINYEVARNWIDLCPHRRTAAVIGVLNVRDCPDEATLKLAQEEWQQWAERYSTPPYEVTAHGRDLHRDKVVQRLFVFDSFDESNKVDLSTSLLGHSIVAFPPTDAEHIHMMDLHMNVVMNDLAVSVFRALESKIRASDEGLKGNDPSSSLATPVKPRFFMQRTSSRLGEGPEEGMPQGSDKLSISSLAAVVSPDSKLAARDVKGTTARSSLQVKFQSAIIRNTTKGASTQAQLLTPLDDVFDFSELSPKDAHEITRREVGRREKFAADLSLLAGSPLDAYERYMKAAELCRSACPDPLWYSSALEGCVAAHIAMAEMGGFNVDEYLESSFQLPESIMACAVTPAGEKSNKQDFSSVVAALCDDALNVLSRHSRLASFRAELLLKLAWYGAELEDTHVRCQWGLGEGCHGGDPNATRQRWEAASATQLNFLELKNKKGEDVIARNTLERSQKFSSYLHQAAAIGGLEPVTRADVALRCASLCLKGLRPTTKPTVRDRPDIRLPFYRKASFFAIAAAESISEISAFGPDDRVGALWSHAARLLPKTSNSEVFGSYGWATLRAVALHGLAMQGLPEASESAAVQLLSLIGEISPSKGSSQSSLMAKLEEDDDPSNLDESVRTDTRTDSSTLYLGTGESVVSAARSYVRETRAKAAEARKANFFSGVSRDSSLLTVAQSKWVEDEEIPTILLPMAELSDISESIIAMRCVWSGIRLDNCSAAQKKVVNEISSLRKKVPASSVPTGVASSSTLPLPIKIISLQLVDSAPSSKLERVKIKSKEESTGAMATFYNPFAVKKGLAEATIVPEGEETYILVRFANHLSIPLEVPRCQLEFEKAESDLIKAPAVSFVIPGQARDFAVQFPFMVLNASEFVSEAAVTGLLYEVKGLRLTCLARSFFLPLAAEETPENKMSWVCNIPEPASTYPLRDSRAKESESSRIIPSPKIEVVPTQPNLHLSFAAATAPIRENVVIPVPIADGEVFSLPKIVLANDLGIGGRGNMEELNISASGLPGFSNLVLFDFSGVDVKEEMKAATTMKNKVPVATPLTLSAHCENMDKQALNNPRNKKVSSLSLKLTAASNLGSYTRGCTVKLSFRYRGPTAAPSLEVWRRREIEIRIVRIKGPRMLSLTFRPDLNWDSCYPELCLALAQQDKRARYISGDALKERPQMRTTETEERNFVVSRLGTDSGVHVCGDKVIAFVAVANESTTSITLSSTEGSVGGFEGNTWDTIKVHPGVSVKVPVIFPRLDRAPGVDQKISSVTRLLWKSEAAAGETNDSPETGGTIVPLNKRTRAGCIEIPLPCLKTIIDENPMFLSRVCKSPCAIEVAVYTASGEAGADHVSIGKLVNVAVDVELANWIPDSVLGEVSQTLEFCCTRKGNAEMESVGKSQRTCVWTGHTRKAIGSGNRKHSHKARILLLEEGEYIISACLTFSQMDTVKEIWWAERARIVQAVRSPPGQ